MMEAYDNYTPENCGCLLLVNDSNCRMCNVHGRQDRDGSWCNEVYWWVIGMYMHHAWLTHIHTSPILALTTVSIVTPVQ